MSMIPSGVREREAAILPSQQVRCLASEASVESRETTSEPNNVHSNVKSIVGISYYLMTANGLWGLFKEFRHLP